MRRWRNRDHSACSSHRQRDFRCHWRTTSGSAVHSGSRERSALCAGMRAVMNLGGDAVEAIGWKIGGSEWESNPPSPSKITIYGFEDRESHRTPCASKKAAVGSGQKTSHGFTPIFTDPKHHKESVLIRVNPWP